MFWIRHDKHNHISLIHGEHAFPNTLLYCVCFYFYFSRRVAGERHKVDEDQIQKEYELEIADFRQKMENQAADEKLQLLESKDEDIKRQKKDIEKQLDREIQQMKMEKESQLK